MADLTEIKPETNNVLQFRTAVTNFFKNIAECVREQRCHNLAHGASAKLCVEVVPLFCCVERSRTGSREEEFMKTMTILESNPTLAKKLRTVLVKELYEGMCADLDDILAQEDLAVGLDKAGKLAHEALNCPDEILWRPPGDVKEHLRSLEAQAMIEETERLAKQVEEMNKQNAAMMKEITKRRAKVQAIQDRTNRASKMVPFVLPKLEKTVQQLQELANIAQIDKK